MPQEPLPVSPVWLSALPQDHKWYLSYEKCLRLESSDLKVSGCLPAEMSARILGYLLQEAPTDAGRDYIARAIDICVDTPALLQLAKNYLNSILKFFKTSKSGTPTAASHSSRSSVDDQEKDQDQVGFIVGTKKYYLSGKSQALLRDRFRCVVTGIFDYTCLESRKYPDLEQEFKSNTSSRAGVTHAAYVITPEGTTQNNAESREKIEHAEPPLAILEGFGQVDSRAMNGDKLHDVNNIMTLDSFVHSSFEKLEVWFEPHPDGTATYSVCTILKFANFPRKVTFETHDPVRLPVPRREYLILHAACARVAHMSGAADYVEKVFRELESATVLAYDGSSADILNAAFARNPGIFAGS